MEDGNFLRKSVHDITSLLDINFGSSERSSRKGKGSQGGPTSCPVKAKPVLEVSAPLLVFNLQYLGKKGFTMESILSFSFRKPVKLVIQQIAMPVTCCYTHVFTLKFALVGRKKKNHPSFPSCH